MLTMEQMLPIGTVVSLKGEEKNKYSITGYALTVKDKRYDYCAVLLPLGEKNSLGADRVFDAEDIDQVIREGFRGENPAAFELTKQLVLAVIEKKDKRAKQAEGGTALI